MTFSEVWDLTLADVQLAVDAHERRERSEFWRAGLIASAVVNAAPFRKKGRKAATPEDFMPRAQRRKEPQTAEHMAAMLKAATVVMGGQVIDTTAGGSHAQP